MGAADLHRHLLAGGSRHFLRLAVGTLRGHRHRAGRFQDGERVALGGTGHGLLGHQDGVGDGGLVEHGTHVHARQQGAVRVGYLGAQRHLTGALFHRQVSEQQCALVRVLGTVVELDAHAGAFAMAFGGLELAAGQTLAQLHHGRCRLGDVHVHRIDLLDGGQRGGSPLADQRTFRHQRTADAAADGGGDRRVRQVDLGRLQVGTGHGDVGSGLALGRHGVVIVQLADGVGLHQRRVAGHLLGGQLLGRLGAHQGSLGAVVGGAQRGRVDLEQHLAGLHVTAFLEEALFQNAGGSRADLGHARRFDPARQVLGKADG